MNNRYYDFRKAIHKLYNEEASSKDDLCSKILEIRDKEKCVESISIFLEGYNIDVNLADNTDETKKQKVINRIGNCIGRYIVDNMGVLGEDITEDPEFDEYLNSPSYNFIDIYLIGNTVHISL